MKLFDKFKKPQEEVVEEAIQNAPETVEETSQQAEQPAKEENEEPTGDFFMVIQDVFEAKEDGCVVVGEVAGATVHKGEEIIIRKNNGTKIESKILEIELYGEFHVLGADVGMPVGMRIEGVEKSELEKGDRIISAVGGDITDKVKETETLYVLFDQKTALPFVGMHCAEVYTKEEYANQAVEHYEKVYRNITVKEVSKEHMEATGGLPLFAYLYYMGLENVIIDNGIKGVMIKRSEVLAPPDWSNLPELQVPVTNPDLRFKLNCYLSELRSGITYDGQKEMIKKQEAETVAAMREGKYLMPVQKGEGLAFAIMKDREGKIYQPMFTDWIEFHKIYDKKEWGGMIGTFKDCVSLGYQRDGIVINPLGENMTLGKELIQNMFGDLVPEQ